MAITLRSDAGRLLQAGLNTVWGDTYKPLASEWNKIFKTESSKKAYEEDVLVRYTGAASIVGEATEIPVDSIQQGWVTRYVHQKVGISVHISEEAQQDNLYMQLGAKATKAMARSMMHTKEIICANVLNNAFSNSFLGGDGVCLLSVSHPLMSGGVFSNTLATPADLSEAALEDILVQIRLAKDDSGIPIGLNPVDLIIPPQLWYIANRLINSTLRTNTPNNDINVLNDLNIFARDPCVITRLTDADAWFIKTDAPDGLKLLQRTPVDTRMVEDEKAGTLIYLAKERYSVGWTDPRGIFGSAGA